jgi:two-component system, chemotaxis family, protein-glutamate methylesterase/glutaminase
MGKIRILVVEDSTTIRRRLCEVLAASPELEVVGEAGDGQSAIEQCQELRPDVITLDMMLPVLSGLGATEYIMAHCPTPILIVSSSFNRGALFNTYDALAAGAVDVLEKPRGDELDGEWEQRLISTVKLVSHIKVITHPRGKLGALGRAPASAEPASAPSPAPGCGVVALGASTGGPGAVRQILRDLPSSYPLPVLLVVHIGELFGAAFAQWLDGQSSHRVSYALHGEPVEGVAGRVVMAPPNQHLRVRGRKLCLSSEPERHSCRPSVDVLFESLALEYGSSAAACLLTGMGRDGAAGLLAMRRAGALTLAQDEASCVVYGMPREAVKQNAACQVLPLAEIGPALASLPAAWAKRRLAW